jgi:hypothetical protein
MSYVVSGGTEKRALAYWYTTPEVVGSNPTSGEEFVGGAWFIPQTETVNNVITTFNVIPTYKNRSCLYGNPPKP